MLSARPTTFSGSVTINPFARKHKVCSDSADSRFTCGTHRPSQPGIHRSQSGLGHLSQRLRDLKDLLTHLSQDLGVIVRLSPTDTPRQSNIRPYMYLGAKSHIGTLLPSSVRPYLGATRHIQSGRILERYRKASVSGAAARVKGCESNHRRPTSQNTIETPSLGLDCGGAERSGYRFAHAPRWSAVQ